MLLAFSDRRQTPSGITDVIDINLNGTLYFARLAVAYLKEKHSFDEKNTTADKITSAKCITLVASVAGFKESPGLFAYSAAKHGVVGLMRALRGYISQLYGLRVNAICMLSHPCVTQHSATCSSQQRGEANHTLWIQALGQRTPSSFLAFVPSGPRTTCP